MREIICEIFQRMTEKNIPKLYGQTLDGQTEYILWYKRALSV